MGMGYSANYADVISEKDVKEIVPKEYDAFIKALNDNGSSLSDFACNLIEDLPEDKQQPIDDAWFALEKAFELKTRVNSDHNSGLWLSVEYHDSNDGSRYDDVDGVFFSVGNLYYLTEAGKNLQGKIERKFYVTYG